MTLFFHELKRNRVSLIIWSAAIAFMLGVCVFLYPEMASQMDEISDMFADMGGFSAAFGMDQLNFGEFIGYFSVECGNVMGLGGALFAAILGISALAKEEKEHTADFLLTHPVSRCYIVTSKLSAILTQIVIMNLVVIAVTAVGILAIKETVEFKIIALLFLSYFLLQVEIAFVCFGISAFLRRSGLGIGLGLAFVLYFMNIISNLTEDAKFLKYITPFGYADGAEIVNKAALRGEYVAVGCAVAAGGIGLAYYRYLKKDIS